MSELTLLTRAGCSACERAQHRLTVIATEFEVPLTVTDVDEAAFTDSSLRAEFGDRLPVILLDGREHSYWEVDEPRLRADLKGD